MKFHVQLYFFTPGRLLRSSSSSGTWLNEIHGSQDKGYLQTSGKSSRICSWNVACFHIFSSFFGCRKCMCCTFLKKFWTSWLTHPLAKYLNCLKHVLSFWPYKIHEKSMNFEISQICFSLKVVLTWSLLKNLSLGSRVVPVWSGYVFSLLINVWRLIRKW